MLRRFLDYTDKVFGFSKALSEITETRSASRISTQSLLWSSSIMHLTRLGSLNALDVDLRLPKRIESFMGKDKPGVDTIDVPLRVLHTIEAYTEKVEENGRVVE